MDTPDRSDGTLSPWPVGAVPSLSPLPSWSASAEAAGAPHKPFSPRLVMRAVRRHWWQILLIWVVASGALVVLAYYKVKPTYEAIAWLNVEPANRSLIAPSSSAGDSFGPYLETQVVLVTSPDVLGSALQNKAVARLTRIRTALDAEAELRREIKVANQPKTHLILVSMTSESPAEAATIVNSIVDSYIKIAKTWTDDETRARIKQLDDMKSRYSKLVEEQRASLRRLTKEVGPVEDRSLLSKNQATIEEFLQLRARQSDIEIERTKAEADVKYLENYLKEEMRQRSSYAGSQRPEADLQQEVADAFRSAPDIAEIINDIVNTKEQLKRATRLARKANDPPVIKYTKQLADLNERYQKLWDVMQPVIERRIKEGPTDQPDPVTQSRRDELRMAQQQLNRIKIEEAMLTTKLKEIEVKTKDAGDSALDLRFKQEDLSYNEDLLKTVDKNLAQLEYEASNNTRISKISEARPQYAPTTNNRIKIMAATPFGVLALVLGLFVVVEAKSGRVADPDDLPARVRVGVIGVVPPLPTLSTKRSGRSSRDEKRRIEEFVQSLDHLRVTLCAARPGMGPRRCVLITSACGGEGKTTLAAQLAGRCANAGLQTLLIDADLRRPSLGELLEVPEGPGLVDVLLGEATPEAAMVVIGNAGGFHLLPAGTSGQDPSRLLHGDRLGQIIAQFREAFDIVIVDAPPVLAVPDALLIGRWSDGAVLAVRHDTSRFPLVERANRRLASVGVPVLGAVVNGVRSMESTYGSYRYTPYASTAAEDAPA